MGFSPESFIKIFTRLSLVVSIWELWRYLFSWQVSRCLKAPFYHERLLSKSSIFRLLLGEEVTMPILDTGFVIPPKNELIAGCPLVATWFFGPSLVDTCLLSSSSITGRSTSIFRLSLSFLAFWVKIGDSGNYFMPPYNLWTAKLFRTRTGLASCSSSCPGRSL